MKKGLVTSSRLESMKNKDDLGARKSRRREKGLNKSYGLGERESVLHTRMQECRISDTY